jgi:hypothetical protein
MRSVRACAGYSTPNVLASVQLRLAQHAGFRAGYFSLNVPAGLTIYWLTNNILTTAQQLYLKKITKIDLPKPRGTIVNKPVIDVEAGSTSEGSAAARRSRKGETFRARQVRRHASADNAPQPSSAAHGMPWQLSLQACGGPVAGQVLIIW